MNEAANDSIGLAVSHLKRHILDLDENYFSIAILQRFTALNLFINLLLHTHKLAIMLGHYYDTHSKRKHKGARPK